MRHDGAAPSADRHFGDLSRFSESLDTVDLLNSSSMQIVSDLRPVRLTLFCEPESEEFMPPVSVLREGPVREFVAIRSRLLDSDSRGFKPHEDVSAAQWDCVPTGGFAAVHFRSPITTKSIL